MSREKTLVKNTLIYALGNFASKFLSFILLPLYTYYLTTNDYGYFDMITTTISLIIPIITFQITDGLYRYMLESNSLEDTKKVISNSLLILVINLIIFNILFLTFAQFKLIKYEYLVLVQINLTVISSTWLQVARGLKHNAIFSISGVISTFVTLIFNIILIVFLKMKVDALIITNIISLLSTIIYIEYKIKIISYINFHFIDKSFRKKIITYSIPLIPNVVNWWFMNVSDRYILNYFLGTEANGIYAVSNKFPSILMLVNSVFYLAWQESAITEFECKDRDDFYSNMFNSFMKFQIASVICLLGITKCIMYFMINEKFIIAYKYIPFLYMGVVFSAFSSFYGTGYQCSKDTKGAFYTSIGGAIINIIINIILVPIIGIQGASLSTMLAFLAMWIVRIKQTKKYFNIKINFKQLNLLIIISYIYIYLYYKNNILIEFISIIMSIVIFILFNNDLLVKGVKYAKHKICSR